MSGFLKRWNLIPNFEMNPRSPFAKALFHPYTLFLLVAFAVYLPDRFNIGDINDGWMEIGNVIRTDVLLRGGIARTFGAIPMWFGLHLDFYDFRGLQILMLLFTVIRASLVFEIVKRMAPGSRLFALAAGLIAAFHPADRGFFWVGAIGLFFIFDVALAACLTAIAYLKTGARVYLLATIALQLIAGLSYSGYIPLMVAIPAGAWLLSRVDGEQLGVVNLLKLNLVPVLCVCAALFALHTGGNRDSMVADFDLLSAARGFRWAGITLSASWLDLFQVTSFLYLLPALLVTVFALQVAIFSDWHAQPAAVDPRAIWLPLSVIAIGLLVVGLCAYVPVLSFSKKGLWHAGFMLGAGTAVCSGLLALAVTFFLKKTAHLAVSEPVVRFQVVATEFAGLLLLALLSYFPYAISTVRFLPDRTLLGAGIFAYSAALLLIFALLSRYAPRGIGVLLVALVAGLVVVSGLKTRDYWVTQYRMQEGLLSALSKAIPQPAPRSFILVRLQTPYDEKRLQGFTYREAAFTYALEFMYGDVTLAGGFYGFGGNVVKFDDRGILTRPTRQPKTGNRLVRYDRLIVVDYDFKTREAKTLGVDWPIQPTELNKDFKGYVPPVFEASPNDKARTCMMLEPAFRPDYCKRGPIL